ncbi:MAG: histidine kinase [Bacteroidota bacterium]
MACCLGGSWLFAQGTVLTFHHLGPEEGLSSAQFNNYILNDSNVVWISSIAGLNRFDGKSVEVFTHRAEDSTSLFSNFASMGDMYQLDNGDVIFPNETGLITYQRKKNKFQRHYLTTPTGDTLPPYFQWGHYEPATDEYWLSNEKAVYVTSGRRPGLSRKLMDGGYSLSAKVFYAAQDIRYYCQIRQEEALFYLHQFRGDSLAQKDTIFSPSGAKIKEIVECPGTNRWLVGTEEGLRFYNPTTQKWSEVLDPTQRVRNIIEILFVTDDLLLIGTQNEGIHYFNLASQRYRGVLRRYYNDSIVPFRPMLERLYLDHHRHLWVSTQVDGVYYTQLDKPKLGMLYVNDPQGYQAFKGIAIGNDQETQWILAPKGVLALRSQDTSYYPLPISGQNLQECFFVFEDSRSRVWVGTLDKLYVKFPSAEDFIEANILPSSLSNPPGYLGMIELPNGDLIFGTNDMVKFSVNKDLKQRRWLPGNDTSALALHYRQPVLLSGTVDNRLNIFIHREDGQFVLDTTLVLAQIPMSIRYDYYRKKYWIATLDGLYGLHSDELGHYSLLPETLPVTSACMSMEIGQDHALWLGTPKGIMRYDPDLAKGKLFHKADGAQGLEYLKLSSSAAPDGTLYFGGNNGINYFQPAQAESRLPMARPTIVDISINGERDVLHRYTADGSGNPALLAPISLPFTQNSLSLRLSAREYSDPDRCQFRYRLMGSSNTVFSTTTTNPILSLGPLASDEYILEIEATNSDGVWSEEKIRLSIHIQAPWYATPWFYLLCVLGIFLFALWRVRRVKQYADLRTSIAEKEKLAAESAQLVAETETAMLRLQLNPHFIFNSLNSIKSYFLNDRKAEATTYLNRFAGLMRTILNSSEEKLSSLEDEIDFLEEYLTLEQKRIGKQLNWSFILEDDVDPFEIMIPTMILQPFVENAIWHGIAHLDSSGMITLQFRGGDVANRIYCIVTDNGVGREYHRDKKSGRHTSRALSIIERQLSLLNRGEEAGYRIKDLYHTNGHPAGTKVTIWLPADLG